MSDIAYSERDIKAIEKRAKKDFLFNVARKVIRKLINYDSKEINKVSTYPMIDNENVLVEIMNKIAWALPHRKDLKIEIFVDRSLVPFDFTKVENIPNQRNYLKGNPKHISLTNNFDKNSDLILYADAEALIKTGIFHIHKLEIMDKNYFSTVSFNR